MRAGVREAWGCYETAIRDVIGWNGRRCYCTGAWSLAAHRLDRERHRREY